MLALIHACLSSRSHFQPTLLSSLPCSLPTPPEQLTSTSKLPPNFPCLCPTHPLSCSPSPSVLAWHPRKAPRSAKGFRDRNYIMQILENCVGWRSLLFAVWSHDNKIMFFSHSTRTYFYISYICVFRYCTLKKTHINTHTAHRTNTCTLTQFL